MLDAYLDAWRDLTAPGAPFSHTETVVGGIPMRVFDTAPPTMRPLWESTAAYGDIDYLVYGDERHSYTHTHAQVRSLAHTLRHRYGIEAGDRVAVAMRNYPEWIVSYWAITSLGAAIVGLNAWWTGRELTYALRDSSPAVLIADSERIRRLLPELDSVTTDRPIPIIAVRPEADLAADTTAWDEVVDAASAPDTLPDAEIDPDDDACIFYTSGTTGMPKGAQLTHRGSVHNLMNMGFVNMVAAAAGDDQASGERTDPPPQRSVLLPVPLFHVTGCNCVVHPITAIGGKVVLMYKWDADTALELIERERITNFTGVPTMSREMLLSPKWATTDTSSLASMGGGGASIQPDLVRKIDAQLECGRPATGYGLTETHGIVSALSADLYLAKPESVGRPVPVIDARCLDPDGNEVGPGELGELVVRGPNVIKGYLNRPEETAEAIIDGWFRTGDIAFIDVDGFIHIRDRVKDVVIRGGENVHCGEVEAAIYEHEAIAEAAVFGIPDDALGEIVAAAIVLTDYTELTEAELRTHLETRLAAFKIPSRVWIRDQPLPRNANGKFVKRALRAELLD